MRAGHLRDHRGERLEQRINGGLSRRRRAEALASKFAGFEIDQRALDRRAADIDADGEFRRSQHMLRYCEFARPRPANDPIITRNMNDIDKLNTARTNAALQPGMLQAALLDRLTRAMGKNPDQATAHDIYDALSIAVREELSPRWLATQRRVANAHVKRVCYLSVEYLPGRSLLNALYSLDEDLVHEARVTLRGMGHELDDIAAQEIDPGLGNGGLGRLAACFLDSLATLQYPAIGYGIRYDYGIFTQVIDARGAQREIASSWLRLRNPWESPRSNLRYTVRFGGRSVALDGDAQQPHRWVDTQDIHAIAFD